MPALLSFWRVELTRTIDGHVQTSFGRDLQSSFRDEADDIGFEFERDVQDGRHIGHLEVETDSDRTPQFPNIAILDMTPVLAQMDGDAMGAGGLADQGGFERLRFAAAALPIAGFAQGGDVINIDAQFQHGSETDYRAGLPERVWPEVCRRE